MLITNFINPTLNPTLTLHKPYLNPTNNHPQITNNPYLLPHKCRFSGSYIRPNYHLHTD